MDPKKFQVRLGGQAREYFDELLDKGDKAEFDRAAKVVAAIQENPHDPKGGKSMRLWMEPGPDFEAVRPILCGALAGLSHYSGEPGEPLDLSEHGLKGIVDFASVDFQITGYTPETPSQPRKSVQGYLALSGPLNFNDLGVQSGPGYKRRLRDLFGPRRWWLLGFRQPLRVIQDVRWVDDHWEIEFRNKPEPIVVKFQALGYRER